MKLLITVGTRPEIIRLASIIRKALIDPVFDLVIVHTGQNYDYELNEIFFRDLRLPKPDYFLNAVLDNSIQTVGNCIIEIDKVLEIENPDAFLVLGDTNSCITSYAAKRRKIPVFHMEAGNRCFDENVPEEINRKIVDSIADVNLCYSLNSREYLLREGHDPQCTIVTGSPMREVISSELDFLSKDILQKLEIKEKEYLVLSFHRDENVSNLNSLKNVLNAVEEITSKRNIPCVFSVHPRTEKRIRELGLEFSENFIFSKPLGFHDYLALQLNSLLVLSDSGTINEESDILGFRAINLRTTQERPEAMDFGVVPMSGLKFKNIIEQVDFVIENSKHKDQIFHYRILETSHIVLNAILSYTQYINHYKWRK